MGGLVKWKDDGRNEKDGELEMINEKNRNYMLNGTEPFCRFRIGKM